MTENEKAILKDMERLALKLEGSSSFCLNASSQSNSSIERRSLLAEANAYGKCAKALYDLIEGWRKKLC